MSIKLNAQSGGSVALDAPTQTTSSADLTFKLPVADGSANQVIQTNGSGQLAFATPSDTDTKWVYGSAADYDQWGSTTDVEFSGWPTNWQQIRVSFIDISSSANSYAQFFVSTSSSTAGRITSGYQTTSGYFGGSSDANNVTTVTDMGRFEGTAASAYSMNGFVNFYKFSGDKIRFEGDLVDKTYGTYKFFTHGYVTCDPTTSMTHIFFRAQGYAYDAGKFKLDYLAG